MVASIYLLPTAVDQAVDLIEYWNERSIFFDFLWRGMILMSKSMVMKISGLSAPHVPFWATVCPGV